VTGSSEPVSVELLGLRIARVTRHEVVEYVAHALGECRGGWLVTANLDYLRRALASTALLELLEGADLIVADGMPLLWAARLQGTPLPDRVAGSDLVWLLAERAAQEGRSIYLLGGNPGAAEAAAEQLTGRWPSLRVAGISSPWISDVPTDEEVAEIRSALVDARPDLVYVALGSPKQDQLICALRDDLPGTWWIGVGISLSFLAGEVRRAPRWVQRIGMEWLHRLVQEPRRLARRYLIEDLPFAARMLHQSRRDRQRKREDGDESPVR
jgi:N-acetylglucosaminyldiphosphoundecaprenol N-acetyl-beta-D-mannosaminyltransferase